MKIHSITQSMECQRLISHFLRFQSKLIPNTHLYFASYCLQNFFDGWLEMSFFYNEGQFLTRQHLVLKISRKASAWYSRHLKRWTIENANNVELVTALVGVPGWQSWREILPMIVWWKAPSVESCSRGAKWLTNPSFGFVCFSSTYVSEEQKNTFNTPYARILETKSLRRDNVDNAHKSGKVHVALFFTGFVLSGRCSLNNAFLTCDQAFFFLPPRKRGRLIAG